MKEQKVLLALQTSSVRRRGEIWRMWSVHLQESDLLIVRGNVCTSWWRWWEEKVMSSRSAMTCVIDFYATRGSAILHVYERIWWVKRVSLSHSIHRCMSMSATTPSLIIVIKETLCERETNRFIMSHIHPLNTEQLVNLNLKSFIYVARKSDINLFGSSSPWNNTLARTYTLLLGFRVATGGFFR